jgi:hypothetical protein
MARTTIPIELSSTPSIVDGGNATAITINASENVGIGTSPDFRLHVSGTGVVLGLNATSGAVSQRFNENGTARFFLSTLNGSNGLAFVNGDGTSERMRIDSSGNLLVGKTAADNTTVGFRFDGSSGFSSFVRDSNASLLLVRKSNDGDILQFKKDGTTVGSIGTANADSITIGNSTGNLILYAGTVAPSSNSSGGASDGVVDLGTSARRFKDLYLSGGVTVSTTVENGTAQFKTLNSNVATPAEQFYVGNNLGDVDLGNKRGALKFFTGTTERMRIDSSGNLMVGTTTTRTGTNSISIESGNVYQMFRAPGTGSLQQVAFVRNTAGNTCNSWYYKHNRNSNNIRHIIRLSFKRKRSH